MEHGGRVHCGAMASAGIIEQNRSGALAKVDPPIQARIPQSPSIQCHYCISHRANADAAGALGPLMLGP